MARRIVVLPHPEGPTRAVTRLRARSRVTSRTTVCLAKATLTSRSDTAASSPGAGRLAADRLRRDSALVVMSMVISELRRA